MLSVIVPSYQRPDDLEQCLRSLRKNSSTECEVLVLSPELSARTRSICGRYQAVLIDDGSRSGGLRVKSLWSIINRGIDLSTNEFACWLNDDCTVNPGWDAKALSHFHAPVGLVVLRTKGINQSADYEIRGGYLGVPVANYAILRKSTGVRFDENFSWFYGDADISLEMVKNTNWQVVGTTENLIVHAHRQDQVRDGNETDARALKDHAYFESKWHYTKRSGERIVPMNDLDRMESDVKEILLKLYYAFQHFAKRRVE